MGELSALVIFHVGGGMVKGDMAPIPSQSPTAHTTTHQPLSQVGELTLTSEEQKN